MRCGLVLFWAWTARIGIEHRRTANLPGINYIVVKFWNMLNLADLATWEKLESPFENSQEIPTLIGRLTNSFSIEILNEICWEYIYHQNTLYEATIATVPHLVAICEKAEDRNYRMATFINLGAILCELDADDLYLSQIYDDSKINPETVGTIMASYKAAFGKLNSIGLSLSDMVPEMDEEDKRYFLAALATANERFDIAKVICTYSGNDEYMCSCPSCDSEFHLWNEQNKLVIYAQDPVFNKNQPGYPVTPRSQDKPADDRFEWLMIHIDKLEIHSLKPIIGYLFGEAQCPQCNTAFGIFPAISDPLV